MWQFVKEMFGWIEPSDNSTEFAKLADEMIEYVEATQSEHPDCAKVSKLIGVLQEWSNKHCPIL